LFDLNENGGKVIDRVLPSDETVIWKILPNAFANTSLNARPKLNTGSGDTASIPLADQRE